MSKEPEALRLADMLSNISVPNSLAEQSATELRRLHTLNAELLEALKLALSVLDEVRSETFRLLRNGQKLYAEQKVWNAIFVIKQALADSALDRMAENARELGLDYEPEQQKPVANYCKECLTYNGHHEGCSHYASPPASKPWRGLTPAEAGALWKVGMTPHEFSCAIEAKLKEKNHG